LLRHNFFERLRNLDIPSIHVSLLFTFLELCDLTLQPVCLSVLLLLDELLKAVSSVQQLGRGFERSAQRVLNLLPSFLQLTLVDLL
jgi:hypothetical protein